MALEPSAGAITLRCPVPDAVLDRADPTALAALPRLLPLVYIGDQRGRDDVFDRLFAPAARRLTHRVAGTWPAADRWPWVSFTDGVEFAEVQPMYRETLATVLLPERHGSIGHVIFRWFDALLAGCAPIVPADAAQGEAFGPAVLKAATGEEVIERVEWLLRIAASAEHADLIANCLTYLEPFRASHQVRTVNQVLAALAP